MFANVDWAPVLGSALIGAGIGLGIGALAGIPEGPEAIPIAAGLGGAAGFVLGGLSSLAEQMGADSVASVAEGIDRYLNYRDLTKWIFGRLMM